jgi:hypothetical protein
MSTNYVVLSKSQKALQDVLDMSASIVDGSQETFNALPASTEKSHLLDVCNKLNNAVSTGDCDKLTVKNMANIVKSLYERTIKGDTRKASSKYEKEVASLRASLLLGVPADELLKKQDDKENSALYRKNLLLTDKTLQSLINAE